jgi:hypothetical protein
LNERSVKVKIEISFMQIFFQKFYYVISSISLRAILLKRSFITNEAHNPPIGGHSPWNVCITARPPRPLAAPKGGEFSAIKSDLYNKESFLLSQGRCREAAEVYLSLNQSLQLRCREATEGYFFPNYAKNKYLKGQTNCFRKIFYL